MTVKDPICGMEIDPKTAFATREHMGKTFFFCSKKCEKNLLKLKRDKRKFKWTTPITLSFVSTDERSSAINVKERSITPKKNKPVGKEKTSTKKKK